MIAKPTACNQNFAKRNSAQNEKQTPISGAQSKGENPMMR